MGWAPKWVAVSNGVAAPGISITSIARYPQHLDVFCVGADNGIYSSWWDISTAATGWANWFRVAGGVAAPGRRSRWLLAIRTISTSSPWGRTTGSIAFGGTQTGAGPAAGFASRTSPRPLEPRSRLSPATPTISTCSPWRRTSGFTASGGMPTGTGLEAGST
jgi:hypothetical protein